MGNGSTSRPASKLTSSDKKEAMVVVNSELQRYIRAVGTYKQYPRARKAPHANAVKLEIHFWRSSADWKDDVAQLNYKGHWDEPMTYSW